jgi:cytoskeletal protein CcmA (bactofilin family)
MPYDRISTAKSKESTMFGKAKSESGDNSRSSTSIQQLQRSPAASSAVPDSPEVTSSISAGMTIAGKINSDGTVKVFGRIEGELHASTVLISEGAQVEGDIVAEELTIGGRVKGTMHANRVKLTSTALVDGDIFHRSLVVEENARFEGSSRREDNVIDATARVQANRSQSRIGAIEGKSEEV